MAPTTLRPPLAPPAAGTRVASLDALRVLAVCGVVAIHLFGLIVVAPDLRGTPTWWAGAALDLGFVWVVPVFVMISGVLTLDPRAHSRGVAAFYARRAKKIVPALVAWHLIYLFVVRAFLRGEELTAAGVTRMLLDAKVFTALYFLWLVLGLYAVAPVLAAFLSGGGPRRARVLAATLLGWTAVAFLLPGLAESLGLARPLSLGVWTMWWPYVGYFVLGWAVRDVLLTRRATLWTGLAALVLAAEIVWQYGTAAPGSLLALVSPVSYLGPAVMALSLAVFLVGRSALRHLRPSPWLTRLSDASFGVFLMHLLVFETIKRLAPWLADAHAPLLLGCTYLMVLALSFGASIALSRVPYLRALV
ncbi:acyltransferase family protein [Nonomuraea sp. NPDC050310]|uniref:acyltransferase n=1 Tax=Nonomuraea sp. NPDC050310 TaxID=3154935 RepID=UPI0033E25546